ncbi:MAG: hypothetical protein CVT60_04940 [Actinobacteria bacterium HGW-Actinobacteria-10]|nr:MAG: hypothetical protein CVT60_04940 [Actinobacteria bacterium HGW-Actinobacteria-10]
MTTGIATTTETLPDGFRHSRETLEVFASGLNAAKPPVHLDHRSDLPPFGRVVKAWVEPLGDGTNYALHVNIEHPETMSEAHVLEILGSREGMSLGFFGVGVASFDALNEEPELVVALTSALWDDLPAVLSTSTAALPGLNIEVRRLYEHALTVPQSVLLWFVQAVGAITLDALLREHIAALLRAVLGTLRVQGVVPDFVRVAIGSGPAKVEVRVPWSDDPETVRRQVTAALTEAIVQNQRDSSGLYEQIGPQDEAI